jgi:hypothetical protein
MRSTVGHRRFASVVTAAALVAGLGLAGGTGSSAAADARWNAADDYVDTLVYWHHHPDWGLGGDRAQAAAASSRQGVGAVAASFSGGGTQPVFAAAAQKAVAGMSRVGGQVAGFHAGHALTSYARLGQ